WPCPPSSSGSTAPPRSARTEAKTRAAEHSRTPRPGGVPATVESREASWSGCALPPSGPQVASKPVAFGAIRGFWPMKSLCRREIVMALAALLSLFATTPAISSQDPGVNLGAPTLTNSQVQFTLNCESGVTYVIERSPDLQTWTPVLTNNDASI